MSAVYVALPVIRRGSSRRRIPEPKILAAHRCASVTCRPPPRPRRPARRARCSGSRCSGTGCPRARGESRPRWATAFVRSSSWAARIIPGVQKPHCRPCLFQKLSWSGWSCSPSASPSIVVTSAPVGLHRQGGAGLGRHAVDEHGAGAALARVAADLRAGLLRDDPDEMDQQQSGLDLVLVPAAVHRDAHGDFHTSPPRGPDYIARHGMPATPGVDARRAQRASAGAARGAGVPASGRRGFGAVRQAPGD